ncbi:AP2 domain-containing protein [Mammaliicoccus sciuri]|uniref:AP2 domain-containing protein n=1 Tax=Mammaliicoccus sciuri TaxID=1296 RepID=UPI002DB72E50|nr:AP2 domain-containing protein [Mammaliicoccus sciuri]MEB6263623.1 AP2 domain-containing protein [Mammaliicoccus sciuri]
MVKSIYLQDGEEIFVDDEDYERVSQYTWSKCYRGNYRSISAHVNGKHIQLAQFLLKNSFQKLKNNYFTKDNLSTKGSSGRWQKPRHDSKSKYKGVSWNKNQNKWFAFIKLNGKNKHLGYFVNEDKAGEAYNQAIMTFLEGNGYLNVIGEDNRRTKVEYKPKKQRKITTDSGKTFIGVYMSKNNCINILIYFNEKKVYLRKFENVNYAALAYNKCAVYLHGDDVILNDVPMTDELKEFIDNWEIPEKIKQLKD